MGLQRHQERPGMAGLQAFWFFYPPGSWPVRYNTDGYFWMFLIVSGYSYFCLIFLKIIYFIIVEKVYDDFKVYGEALGLVSCCLYGGASYHPQEMSLKRGVDIVVGTPGRIKVSYYCCTI